MAKVVPDGMLVFFPSYGVMETCLERWGGPATSRPNNGNGKSAFFAAKKKQNSSNQYSFPLAPASYYDSNVKSTPWKRMLSTKSVVVEPRSTRDLPDAMAEFKRFLAMPKSPGAILMGVCRGKLAEGIDFSNEMSRAVVITGLPFPPAFDPKVKLKKEFLDKALTSGNIKASADGGFGGSIAAQAHPIDCQGKTGTLSKPIVLSIRRLAASFETSQTMAPSSSWTRALAKIATETVLVGGFDRISGRMKALERQSELWQRFSKELEIRQKRWRRPKHKLLLTQLS
jgi:hypothetical protein